MKLDFAGVQARLDNIGRRKDRTLARLESQMRKSVKASATIRANKRKAKLKAKHRRQRARATA
jgi:hypothetical protein